MAILEEVPLLADEADQTADIVIAGEPYTLRMLWNGRCRCQIVMTIRCW